MSYLRKACTLALVLVLSLSMLVSIPAVAAPTTLDQARSQLDSIGSQLSAAETELMDLSMQLETTRSKIWENEQKISQKQEEISHLQSLLSGRVRSEYKSGFATLLTIVMNTSSIDDLISNIYLSVKISDQESQNINLVKDAKSELDALQKSLENEKARLETAVQDAQAKKAEFDAQLTEARRVYDQLDAEAKAQLAAEAAAHAEQVNDRGVSTNAITNVIVNIDTAHTNNNSNNTNNQGGNGGSKPAPTPAPAPKPQPNFEPSSSDARAIVLEAAASRVGCPYVWGGNGPDVFDCSGYTKWCFAQAGITLARPGDAQRWQISNFKSLDQLVPGDLVWRSGHVGIYAGNGMMYHAPLPGKNVQLVKMSWLNMTGGGWPA